ncbi:hypothetical protein HMSSN139_24940 [Paenibacillus sp. HMSSN-139]|nr:hypothetical protein HMSSN139_24940 [Paenibacillus sp. HMSSN-139]
MPIQVLEAANLFELRTKKASYVFGVNENGGVQHLYWGEPVEAAECVDLLRIRHHSSFDAVVNREWEEYGAWGGTLYAEPCLKVKFKNGVRDLRLRYEGYETGSGVRGDHLVVRLSDEYYRLRVELRYRVIEEYDLIERSWRCSMKRTFPSESIKLWRRPGPPRPSRPSG